MSKLRIAFMGTPDFAVPSLKALAEGGHEIVAVYSQPPRPAGRGHKEKKSPVHLYAEEQGWEVRTPRSFRDAEVLQGFRDLNLDAAVVVAYGLILPREALDIPRLGCLNVHASLLPRWRGAAPIQRAIEAGDDKSGVTIMQVCEELDAGDIVLAGEIPITAETTAPGLHDALAEQGGELIVPALEGLDSGRLTPQPQPAEGVTYAQKLSREESAIDWRLPAAALERKIRALTPWPGVHFTHEGERFKVQAAEVVEATEAGGGEPGTLLDDRLLVACGEGALRILRLQRPGKGSVDATAFLNGYPLTAGTRLA